MKEDKKEKNKEAPEDNTWNIREEKLLAQGKDPNKVEEKKKTFKITFSERVDRIITYETYIEAENKEEAKAMFNENPFGDSVDEIDSYDYSSDGFEIEEIEETD